MRLNLNRRLRIIRRNLKRFLSRKISTRLIISYIGLGVLPLVLVSLILISLTRETLEVYIYEKHHEIALRASNQIQLFIREPLTIMKTAALTREATDMNSFSQRSLVNKIKEENTIFRKVLVLNDSGQVNATTMFGEESANITRMPELKAPFRKGMSGDVYFSEVSFIPSRTPILTLAEPIKRFDQATGVLVAEIDLRSIWALLDSIPVGSEGFVFLLNKDGKVIAHRDKDKLIARKDYSGYDFYPDLLARRQLITRQDPEGERTILVYETVPELSWGVVVQQPYREAFALASQMQQRVLYLAALTILVAALLGVLGVKRLTRPLEQLVKGAREYGSGNLAHKIDLPTKDELAELAQEFNSMAGSLLKNQKKLQRMERLAALSRFASLVSHEIRNPLNAMNINMQILKKAIHRPDITPERKIKYLDVISSEITRINDMVTNFLTIARPPELQLARVNIHEVIAEVLLLQEAAADTKHVRFVQSLAPEAATGMFDYNQLKQVFHNIVVNAFEAMPDGGTLTVRTTLLRRETSPHQEGRFVKIEFSDTGEGIPEEIIREVFEFYYTTKRAGSGMGLAIAKQIVEGHKGVVYIESRKSAGTSIYIELPVDMETADAAAMHTGKIDGEN